MSFETLEHRAIAALGVDAVLYEHRATGARHLHMASADPNNAFMVAFPTLPNDSTGVAHILEHTALCGSERYPVRDPFFMMLRRSLNTFMNAFTGTDTTAYPFATTNRRDFENLLSVYLDAVFFPNLDPLDFAQEGWRLEIDDDDALSFHGVVYNEMKGAMSSPIAQLWQGLYAALFPDTIYRHNSGGDPREITDLTHQQLCDFHRYHYHPAHALFMTYGSFDAAEHQALFEQRALSRFERRADCPLPSSQPPFKESQEYLLSYASEQSTDRATHIVWGWLVGMSEDLDARLDAYVLEGALLDNSASPLRHLLESTGLAGAPSELCGIDDSARDLVFCCGVEGASQAAREDLEAEIFSLLGKVVEQGIESSAINAVLDRLELAQRDVSGSYPYGLQLMQRVLSPALYGASPFAFLDLDEPLQQLRRRCEDPNYLKSLVKRLLIDNPHRVRVVMTPDPGLAASEREQEHSRLAAIEEHLDAEQRAQIRAICKQLSARQNSADDASILPAVGRADVPAEVAIPEAQVARCGAVPANLYRCSSNGVLRAQQVFQLPDLTDDELALMPLFCEFLFEFGAGPEDYLATQRRRGEFGYFGAHASVRADLNDANKLVGWFALWGKGLARHTDGLVDTLFSALDTVRFDEAARLADLLEQARAEAELSITDRGHYLACATAIRGLTPAAYLEDLWEGPESIVRLQALASSGDAQRVFAVFEKIKTALANARREILLIGDDAVLDRAFSRIPALNQHHGATLEGLSLDGRSGGSTAWETQADVNFNALAYLAVPEAHSDVPALTVLGQYLQDGMLHTRIREQGGAYGSGAGYHADASVFRFFSYRDPRGKETFSDFLNAVDWLRGSLNEEQLEQAVLGVIRKLDQPGSPAADAERAFFDQFIGRDGAFIKNFRQAVLNCKLDDVLDVGEKYLDNDRYKMGAITAESRYQNYQGLRLKRERI
ncbi:MAG: insulinase family protein [Pseudomonadota bacterium]